MKFASKHPADSNPADGQSVQLINLGPPRSYQTAASG
jgi:hypothetical protein